MAGAPVKSVCVASTDVGRKNKAVQLIFGGIHCCCSIDSSDVG